MKCNENRISICYNNLNVWNTFPIESTQHPSLGRLSNIILYIYCWHIYLARYCAYIHAIRRTIVQAYMIGKIVCYIFYHVWVWNFQFPYTMHAYTYDVLPAAMRLLGAHVQYVVDLAHSHMLHHNENGAAKQCIMHICSVQLHILKLNVHRKL